jgi:hypothetical protein
LAKAVVVHALADALAALEAAEACAAPVALWSAIGAAAYLGPLFWQMMEGEARAAHPKATFVAVLDCAERPGDAMAAIRQGLKHLCFTGAAELMAKLRDMAETEGATLYGERPRDVLDLKEVTDPAQACRLWFRPAVEKTPPLG